MLPIGACAIIGSHQFSALTARHQVSRPFWRCAALIHARTWPLPPCVSCCHNLPICKSGGVVRDFSQCESVVIGYCGVLQRSPPIDMQRLGIPRVFHEEQGLQNYSLLSWGGRPGLPFPDILSGEDEITTFGRRRCCASAGLDT